MQKVDINQYVGRRIREHRQQGLRLTQEELADRLDISRPSIANIERGRQQVTVSQLVAIAGVLGVPPADFLPSQESADSALQAVGYLPTDMPPEIVRWLESSKPS